jgi:hypothetical protein
MVMEVDLCRFRCLWSLFIHCSVDFGDEVLSEDVNVYVEDEDEREYFIEVRWTMDLSGREVRGVVVVLLNCFEYLEDYLGHYCVTGGFYCFVSPF